MPRTIVALFVAVAVVLLGPGVGVAAAAEAVTYAPPVPGQVVRGFERPPAPWAPGHRGVKLAAQPGDVVRTAAPGRVAFAGAVAGVRWVTLVHADGVRTSYGPLAEVSVREDMVLAAGAPLGTVAAAVDGSVTALHWGARLDGAYIDPLSLLEPLRPSLVGPGRWEVTDLPVPSGYGGWDGRVGLAGRVGIVQRSPIANQAGWSLPPNPNHVIGVAGLSSNSGIVPIDLTHLGYAPDAITYLSYAGRLDTADPVADDPRRDQADYRAAHTWEGVHAAADRLRDQLRAQWARRPGEAVDLVGHSMGGVVVAYYLLTMHDPADPTLPPIGHVVTLAAPLEGADLANAGLSAGRNRAATAAIRGLGAAVGAPLPDPRRHAAVADLAVGSEVTAAVAEGWRQATGDVYAGPLATGTRVLTLGGSRDLVVPERRSSLDGGDHVVLPGGHDRMRRTEASRVAVRAFLAGEPVPGQPGGLGHYASYPVAWAQRGAGGAVGFPWPP